MTVIRDLMLHTGLSAFDVARIIRTAPARYKVYQIPKRTGGRRTIAQPSRELKILQRYLMDFVLRDFPVHPAAMAYVEGRNIGENAAHHRQNSVILKLDFQNFFPSILVRDWMALVRERYPAWKYIDDLDALTKILFWGQRSSLPICLSIGAPSSPLLSNIVMYELDRAIHSNAGESGVRYTRYADDITISGASIDAVVFFERYLRDLVAGTASPRLLFNDEKRGIYTKGQRRLVTGLVLTPNGTVSIGRQRKRLIHALTHKFSLGELDMEKVAYLKGLLGFAIANEPAFITRLREKYGTEVISTVLSTHIPSRAERI